MALMYLLIICHDITSVMVQVIWRFDLGIWRFFLNWISIDEICYSYGHLCFTNTSCSSLNLQCNAALLLSLTKFWNISGYNSEWNGSIRENRGKSKIHNNVLLFKLLRSKDFNVLMNQIYNEKKKRFFTIISVYYVAPLGTLHSSPW
jgi:hypothetical protein